MSENPRKDAKEKRKEQSELDDLLMAWWDKEGVNINEIGNRTGYSPGYARERITALLKRLKLR